MPTSACVNSRRRSWQRRWHASQSAPAAPPGRPGPQGPGGRVNCRPFARRWWSALGSCRSARPCGGRLQHSHASAGVLDRRPRAHQPGFRAPLSAWRHSRTALGHGRSFRGRSDATRLHAAGSRRGHQRQPLLNRDLSPRDLLPTSLMPVAHQKVAGATPRLPNLFSPTSAAGPALIRPTVTAGSAAAIARCSHR